jgi:hypothetical protein
VTSHRTKLFLVAVALLGGLGAVGLMTRRAEANRGCKKIHGRIVVEVTTDNCTSPVLLCTRGTIQGGGSLNGSTAFTTLALAPSAGLAPIVPATTLSYTGQLTITARGGTLVLTDVGILEQGTARFTELDSVVSGTGDFAGNTGLWTISGVVTGGGTGFDGNIEGTLCEP